MKKSSSKQKTNTQAKDTNTKTNKKNMTSLGEPWAQFQKHNPKKRVINKASHCLCQLVSFGRQRDQLCTANCLTLKWYWNKPHPGGRRSRPTQAPGPATRHRAPEQMKWEPELGGRVQQQQVQGSSKFKGDAKDLQACGFWTQNQFGMGKWWTKTLTCERIFCEAVMSCSQWQYWFQKKEGPLPQLQKKFHMICSCCFWTWPSFQISSWHHCSTKYSFTRKLFAKILPIPSRFCFQNPHACQSFASPLNLLLPCNCCCCTLPSSFASPLHLLRSTVLQPSSTRVGFSWHSFKLRN